MSELPPISAAELPLQCFCHWERTRPQQVFLTQPIGQGMVQDITWADAGRQVRGMAAWLQAQGWPAGSRVAIVGKNSAHWLLADLAILMAGHVSVPVYPTFNATALRYILEHSDCKACFVGKLDDTLSVRTGVPDGVPCIALPLAPSLPGARHWDDLAAALAPLQDVHFPPAEAVATIIYTSGTTGKPKGVVHRFGHLAWALSSAAPRFGLGQGERFLSYLPLAHVAERMLIEQGALRFGGHIFFAESLDTFAADLQRARPTIFFSVPRLWLKFQQGVHARLPAAKLQRLLRIPLLRTLVRRKILGGLGLDQCRVAAGGAAPMPAEVLGWYRALGLNLVEVYGMTENCGISHSTLPGSLATGTVGTPYPGVESRIDAAQGEILMRSPAVMQAYYREPEQTAAVLSADGWLRTGDKGHIDAQGQLHITGRVKDIFKTSKGKYIAPAPIEELLVQHPDVEACAVTGAQFAQPFALLMLSADAIQRSQTASERQAMDASLHRHLQHINLQLEPHERLDFLVAIPHAWTPENGLVTPTLKVRRDQLEAHYAAHYPAWLALQQGVVWAA